MKQLFILLVLVAGIPSTQARMAINPPVPESDITIPLVTSIQDEPIMCTMEYAPVCGVNGTTYGNACSAGKNKIAYTGECDSYVDNVLYTKLENFKKETLKKQLAKYSDEKLLSVLPTIDQKISMVKLSRIARESQVEKITLYTFVRNSIPDIITSRSITPSRKRPGIENISYTIEGQVVKLTDGVSEASSLSGSASKTITRLFGNSTLGDVNGDDTLDVAFILTQETGGSGVFYYAVVALMTENGYVGTNTILLGDRITPQTIEMQNGQIIVNYMERKSGEAMSTTPTVATSKYFKISGTTLTETTK